MRESLEEATADFNGVEYAVRYSESLSRRNAAELFSNRRLVLSCNIFVQPALLPSQGASISLALGSIWGAMFGVGLLFDLAM
jgi:hypothetical protein